MSQRAYRSSHARQSKAPAVQTWMRPSSAGDIWHSCSLGHSCRDAPGSTLVHAVNTGNTVTNTHHTLYVEWYQYMQVVVQHHVIDQLQIPAGRQTRVLDTGQQDRLDA